MLQRAHGLMGMPSSSVHQQLTPQDFVNILILVQEPKFIKLRHAVPQKQCICTRYMNEHITFIFTFSSWQRCLRAGIYRWRIILADTDFFQQSVSVSAANFRDRNNRPSAKHFFIKLLMNFSWTFDEFLNFMCTLWHCRFDRTLSYSTKVCAHKIPKFIKILFCLTRW